MFRIQQPRIQCGKPVYLILLLQLNTGGGRLYPMKAKVGDKVRIKSSHVRGIVEAVKGKSLLISLDEGGTETAVGSEVTNFSLAARKAWESMPERRVGRPKGTSKTDRVSVTLRIDRELWARFKKAEQEKLITDRTGMVNKWIAEKLDELEKK